MEREQGRQSSGTAPIRNACLQCRSVKMRCRREDAAPKCERCTRKGMECVVEKHQRGRKPGTRLARREWGLQVQRCETSPERALHAAASLQALCGDVSKPHYQTTLPDPPAVEAESSATINDLWGDSNGLQPAELLSKKAKTGTFSLQSVLGSSDSNERERAKVDAIGHESSLVEPQYESGDPIQLEILNFPTALGLFDSFMRSLNPYISHFDPKLHTLDYVRRRSAFLLTAILAAAAKAFHPPLHSQLRAHSETLLAKCFSQGAKSTETVQAILVSTYWKDPEDTRSWLFVGYAVRICMELGWHTLEDLSDEDYNMMTTEQIREAINIRRTWLILFVYDRSISLQLGKPWMIELSNFILNSERFYLKPHAIYGGDALLCAFVSLRIISSEILELTSQQSSSDTPPSEHLLKLLNDNITRWENHWFPILDDNRTEPCQPFLVRFYSGHLRLLLNSLSLQETLVKMKTSNIAPNRSLWICFTSALGMLKQIYEKLGHLKLLYFAQDSVHFMTAYAAVFLIKLLLSLPSHLRKDFESPSIEGIKKTAMTFEGQCATQQTACAFQARFLSNVITQYKHLRTQSSRPPSSESIQRVSKETVPPRQSQGPRVTIANEGIPSTMNTQVIPQSLDYNQDMDGNIASGVDMIYDLGYCNFEDDKMWEDLFANAGYRINTGVFIPPPEI